MDAQELQKLNIARIYHASTGQTLREQDLPLVMKFAEGLAKELAERAVSPAESVQSIDGAVFQGLLADYCDAYCALNGGEERTMDCMDSLLGYLNKKLTGAHAEGRRSAMEELAKEKERADRAETQLEIEKKWASDMQLKAVALTDKLAARQAPDLSDAGIDALVRSVCHSDPIAAEGQYCLTLDELRALLSSTAQPLQQEGGKEQGPVVFMDEIDAAQAGEKFLAQYYSGAVRMEYSPNDGPRIPAVKWAILLDWKDRIVAGYLLTRDLKNWTQLTRFTSSDAAPQPSDNLQQASTAQVEPAKRKIDPAQLEANALRRRIESATAADWPEDFAHENGNYENRCSECGIGFMGHKRRSVCKVCATPAQATPEGADLPPEGDKYEGFEEFERYAKREGLSLVIANYESGPWYASMPTQAAHKAWNAAKTLYCAASPQQKGGAA